MKVLIDIPDAVYKASQIIDVKYEDVIQIPLEVITNGVPIPDNTPNRQVFEILFPETELKYVGNMIGATEYEGKCIDIVVDDKWWNASYKGEDND
jgi:hypothetical protein